MIRCLESLGSVVWDLCNPLFAIFVIGCLGSFRSVVWDLCDPLVLCDPCDWLF